MCRAAGERPIPQGGDQERPGLRGEGEIFDLRMYTRVQAAHKCFARIVGKALQLMRSLLAKSWQYLDPKFLIEMQSRNARI